MEQLIFKYKEFRGLGAFQAVEVVPFITWAEKTELRINSSDIYKFKNSFKMY